MRFKYAESGVKKIFSAQILELIGAALLIVSGVVVIFAIALGKAAGDSADTAVAEGAMIAAIPALIVMGGAMVVMIIAAIFNIIGVTRASNDEPAFRIALYAIIATIVLTAVSTIFSTNGMVSSLAQSLTTITELVTLIYVIQGIRNLATKLNNFEVDEKGSKLLMIILVVVVLRFIANIIVMVFGGVASMEILAAVFLVVSGILAIVQYFMYLVYLAKARKMLAE